MYVFYLQMLWNCFFKNQLNNTQSSTPVILSMLGLVVFNSLYIHVLRNNHSAFFIQFFFLIFNNMIFKLFDYQNFHIFTNAKSSHLKFFFSKCIFYHAKSVFFRKVIINQTSKWHNYLFFNKDVNQKKELYYILLELKSLQNGFHLYNVHCITPHYRKC